jgi:type I restriction enzyme R subunit
VHPNEVKYGATGTPAKFWSIWKEDVEKQVAKLLKKKTKYTTAENRLITEQDKGIYALCSPNRLLDLAYKYIVFDGPDKKICRYQQYFAVQDTIQRVKSRTKEGNRQGGVIWHTTGSGKSLTMVWLAKWIRENVRDSRILIITDREELDDQIDKLFTGIDEKIYRTKSGRDLISILNHKTEMLVCSLVHKFGRNAEDGDFDTFIAEVKANLGTDFSAKGDIYVFVDECHRTQSGKLHDAMKMILPDALFIGFTGTPLLKKDKQWWKRNK